MESCPAMSINVSDIIASVKTLGCATGAVLVLLVELILLLVFLWLRMRRKSTCIHVPSADDHLGDFSISFTTIRTHLRSVLSHSFPQLHVKRISLLKRGSAFAVVIDAYADASANMIKLRDTVRQELQSSLVNQLGLKDIFSQIDIRICGMNASPGSSGENGDTSLPQPSQNDEAKRPTPLSLLKDKSLGNEETPATPVN